MFELYYLPMHVELWVEQPETPGMLVSLPPRRTQRSRSQDVVSIFLTLLEGTPPPARFLENMLDDMVLRYYNSSGSITSGLRTAAEHLNSQLLDYNEELLANHKGAPVVGVLNMAVLKGDLLSIMHAGPTSTWLLQPAQLQTYENYDEQGKGLGISRTVPVRFFQTSVSADSLLLFCANPSENWTEASLTHGSRLTINLLRRRLLASDSEQYQAGIIQFKPADQLVVRHLRLRSLAMTDAVESETDSTPASETDSQISTRISVEDNLRPKDMPAPEPVISQSVIFPRNTQSTKTSPKDNETPSLETSQNVESETPVIMSQTSLARQRADASRKAALEKATEPKAEIEPQENSVVDPEEELQRSALRQAKRKKVAATWQSWNQNQQKVGSAVNTFCNRLLPGFSEESPKLTGSFMLLISILIPLVVVFFAASIYMQQGRDEQHKLYLDQAYVYAGEARNAEDTAVIQDYWQQTLYWLDLANEYQKSDESRQLRREANNALDAMKGVERLDFQDLYPYGFSKSFNFTQIAVNDTEVYLLDSVQGNVIRLYLTGQGYQMDEEFSCGPGATGTQVVGKIVDLVSLPTGNPNKATILAVDGNGNAMYCIPGAVAPLTSTLVAPEQGWGEIQAIALYQGMLYVLDSGSGAVYYYYGFTSGYADTAYSFFDPERDATIPELGNMVDLAAYEEDLYLLNQNGTIAHCTSGIWEINQTRCDDPASFGDMRPIQTDDALLFTSATFTQIETSTQPEPSLYLLDTSVPSIYRFSLQLNLDRLLQAVNTNANVDIPDVPATAFTITSNREVFLAYGNRVFYAPLSK